MTADVRLALARLGQPDLAHPTAAEARARAEAASELHAFISFTDEVDGTPAVAVKDLVDVRGTVTTAGGTQLPMQPAERDAPVIERLRAAGCAIVGKTGLDEFAFGSTGTNPHYGDVLNPHDSSRVAGGSSGGSAVAAAIGACAFAIGTDTGGSIRIPSSLCGVVGIKPTMGLVPTEGVIPLSTTLDTLGPIAADLTTAAAGLEVLAGIDVLTEPDQASGYRVGAACAWAEGLDEPTAAAWAWATEGLPNVDLPAPAGPSELGLTVLYYEAARYHERWLEHTRERYAAKIVPKLRRGLSINHDAYLAARESMLPTREIFETAMGTLDAVLVPATACVAPPATTADEWHEPLTRFMRPFNLTGQPVVALPVPVTGLPVGVQLVGRWGRDADLVHAAAALEQWWVDRGATRP